MNDLRHSKYCQVIDGKETGVSYRCCSNQEMEEGAFGKVMKALRITPDGQSSEVALKLFTDDNGFYISDLENTELLLEERGNTTIYEKFQKFRQKMRCTVEPLASKLFLVEDEKNVKIVAMDYAPWIEEKTLEKLIESPEIKNKSPEERVQWACPIIEQMLERFVTLHELEVLHRDIHIGNLALRNESEFWIFDYSLTYSLSQLEDSSVESGKSTTKGRNWGFYGRARDPLRKEKNVNATQAELYAIGNVAHSLFTSEPSPGSRLGSRFETPKERRLWLLSKKVPEPLAEWIARMTSLDLDTLERPGSCEKAKLLFHKAMEAGDTPVSEAIRDWLDKQTIVVGSKNKKGLSLMHFASQEGSLEVVEWLKWRGEDVNAKDNNGNTPIFEAAMTGKTEIIDWLATHGANVNAINNDDRTAMHCAAARAQLNAMQRLKVRNADIDAKDNKGLTPFHLSVIRDYLDAMVWLKIWWMMCGW